MLATSVPTRSAASSNRQRSQLAVTLRGTSPITNEDSMNTCYNIYPMPWVDPNVTLISGQPLNIHTMAAWAILLSRHMQTTHVGFYAAHWASPVATRDTDPLSGVHLTRHAVPISPADSVYALFRHYPWPEAQATKFPAMSDLTSGQCEFLESDTIVARCTITSTRPLEAMTAILSALMDQMHCPLLLLVLQDHGSHRLNLGYDQAVYTPATIESLGQQLQTILESLVRVWSTNDPAVQCVKDIPWVSDAEQTHLLQLATTNPPAETMANRARLTPQALFARWAACTPDELAVVQGSRQVTYGQLNSQILHLAHILQVHYDVARGTRVAFLGQRSLDATLAILAIVQAGGTFVPIDSQFPADRVAFIFEDSGCAVVLATRQDVLKVPNFFSGGVIVVDDHRTESHATCRPNFYDTSQPNDLAYIIYTSGTTGRPKGVMVEYGSLVNIITEPTQSRHHRPGTQLLQIFNVAFDGHLYHLFGALWHGATLVIAGGDPLLDLQRVDVAMVTPSFLIQVDPAQYPNLKVLRVAGEPCSSTMARRWAEQCELVNMYGPIETTIASHCAVLGAGKPVVIGKPLANVHCYVVDQNLALIPHGMTGELLIGGVGVARGYCNLPEITAERFFSNPFGPGRVYRTGDLVRWLPDGSLEYIGRCDNQVKLNGFRIELEEVESVAGQCRQVQQAAVLVHRNHLVCFVTPELSDFASLMDHLRQKLPHYIVPHTLVALAQFPTTINGKVDKNALAQLDPATTAHFSASVDWFDSWSFSSEPLSDSVANATYYKQELALHQAQAESPDVPIDRVVHQAHFSQLDGDSINANQLSPQMELLSYCLPIHAILERMPLRDLADTMDECEAHVAPMGLPEPARDAPIPLTPIQATFFGWSLYNPHHFNQSFVMELTQSISRDQFNDALQQLVCHHAVLRSQFIQAADGTWVQRIAVPAATQESLVDEITCDHGSLPTHLVQVQRKLDLAKGQLLRGALIHLQSDVQATTPISRLFLTAHHLVIDLVSWRILLEDLHCLLQKWPLVPVPLPFGAWACALQDWGEQWIGDDSVGEYTLSLPSMDPIVLNLNTKGNCETMSFTLPAPLTSLFTQLESYAKGFSVTPTELLLAALAQALHRLSTEHTVTIWHENHGRHPWSSDIDLSRTVGWFTALYPVTVTIDTDWTHTSFLRRIKHALRTLPHHGLVYGMQRMRQSNRSELSAYQPMGVVFNYLGKTTDQSTLTLHDQAPWTMRPDLTQGLPVCDGCERRPQLLEVLVYQQDDTVQFDLLYCPQVIPSATIATLTHELQQALHGMLDEYARHEDTLYWAPSDFPLLDWTWDDLNAIGNELVQQNINPASVEAIYPCLPLQENLLLPLTYDTAAHLVQMVMTIRGPLDTNRFQWAWVRLIKRHPILRTCFVCPPQGLRGGILQVVLSTWSPEWVFGHENSGVVDASLPQYTANDLARGFQLNQPLLRLALFRVSASHHRFVLTTHHAISDGWSLELMLAEIKTLYCDRTTAPPGAYRDVIAYVVNQSMPEALAYWRHYLQSIMVPSYLPSPHTVLSVTSQPRFVPESFNTVAVSTAQYTNLMEWAQQNGVTLSTVLCAAWAMVLHLYTGQTNVVLGVTVSGRDIPVDRVERVVGPCINTLPCCAQITPTTTIVELVSALHQASIAMAPFVHSRLADVQAHTAIGRGQPLFNTLLAYENYLMPPLDSTCPFTLNTDATTQFTEYPLTILAKTTTDGIACSFMYRRDYFPSSYMHQVAQHFTTALEALAAESNGTLVTCVDLLSAQEKALVQGKYANNPCPVLVHHAHQYVLAQVRTHPDAPALRDSSSEISYAQLDTMASGVAAELTTMVRVGSDRIVAIVADNSFELVVGQLAIWKAGCAFVVIDPRYPVDRKRFMLEDAQCIAVMGILAHLGEIDPSVPWLCLDDMRQHCHRSDTIPTFNPPPPTALAWVTYTSGSTGQPKGVMVEHQAAANHIYGAHTALGMGRETVTATLLTPTLDVSISEIWTTLSFGGTVLVTALDQFHDAISQVPRICCTPSLLTTINPEHYPNLVQVTVTGEPLPPALANRWASWVRLTNWYGSTETTVASHYAHLKSNDYPTIGRPFPNVLGYILNKHLRPVPPGVVGGLYIGGHGVARGYLNQPELTAKTFVANPLGPGRLFKSGDLARWLPDGRMECLGRMDNQVKVRGYCIALREVINTLTQQPLVRHAHVLVQGTHMVAYATPETVDPKVLLAALRRSLPHYMVPSAIIPLSALPLTSAGKVDPRALVAYVWDPANRLLTSNAKSPWQSRVISLLALALNRPATTIHLDDTFFTLGGNSLAAIRLGSLCRDQGLSLSIPRLFAQPHVRDIVEHMAEESISQLSVDSPVVTPFSLVGPLPITTLCQEIAHSLQLPLDAIEDVLPTSALQAQLLTNADMNPLAHMIQWTLTITGAVDPDRYHWVWHQVFKRHSSLRTKFWVTDRVAPYHSVQVVTVTVDFSWKHIEMPHDPANRAHLEKEWLNQDRCHGFQLDGSPLFRLALVTLTPTTHSLFMTYHPALLDTWSAHHILTETVALYDDQPLALPVSHSGFIHHVQADDEEKSRTFWTTVLKGVKLTPAPVLPMPSMTVPAATVAVAAATTTHNTWSYTLGVDWASLEAFGYRHHLTIPTLLRATWALVLARYLGEPSEVTFGTLVSGRNVPIEGIQQMVGMTANTVSCRVPLPGDMPVLTWLTHIQEQMAAMLLHEHTSLVDIAQWIELPSDHALLHSLLVVDKAPKTLGTAPTMASSSFSYQWGSSNIVLQYPLTAHFIEDGPQLRVVLHYECAQYDAAYMQYLGTFIDHCLDLLLHYSSTCCLRDMCSLAPDEAAQLYDWSLGLPCPTDPGFQWLDQAFTRTLHQCPDAIALEAGDFVWTYAQVAYQAQMLARQLQFHRITHGVPVVLLFTRSPRFVFAVLAVLELGGVYVPVDADQGVKRVQAILDDLDQPILVTELVHAPLIGQLDNGLSPVIFADATQCTSPPPSNSAPLRMVRDPSDLAYIIYTSEIPGMPKGVPVRHESVVNTIEQVVAIMALDASCRCLQALNIALDLCVMELFSTFAAGGTVVVSMIDIARDLAHVNTCHLTTSLLAALNADLYPNLTCVTNTGEAFPAAVARQWHQGRRFFNGYGSTETAIVSHVERAGPLETVPVGLPLPNTQCFVLDDRRLLAPVGVVGQVCLAGIGVSDGYWKRPDLTAQVFVPNPFGRGRLYLTGDRGCWLPNGKLKVLGRCGEQVKLHGHRIALKDVEQALYYHPAVKAACVAVQNDCLVGFVTPADVSVAHVRKLIRQILPPYMHPSAVIALPQLPLTPVGKVDRTALPTANMAKGSSCQAASPPQPASNNTFVAIVAQVLDCDPSTIATEATFFQLGGDSLSAFQLAAQCHQAGLKLAIGDITGSHTLARLATLVEIDLTGSPSQAPIIPAKSLSGPIALTPTQREFLRMELEWPNVRVAPMLYRVHHTYSLAQWQAAIKALVACHDMLRFRLLLDPNGAVSSGFIDAPTNDVSQYFSHAMVPPWEKLASAFTQQASKVHYGRGPVCHFALLTQESIQYLLTVVHCLVADQTSMAVLAEDLEALLQNRPLETKAMAYPEWSQKLQRMLNKDTMSLGEPSKQIVLPLPRDMPGPSRNATLDHQQRAALTIEGSLLNQLQRTGFTYETPMIPLLLTGLLMAIEREFQQTSISLALESHGRTAPHHDGNVSRTVGRLAHPCRLTLTKHQGHDLAKAVAATQQALQVMTSEALQTFIAESNCNSTLPSALSGDCPEVAFSYTTAGPDESERSRQHVLQPCPDLLQPSLPDLLPNAQPYLLALSCDHQSATLRLQITYHTNQFWATTIHRVLLAWVQALDALAHKSSTLAVQSA